MTTFLFWNLNRKLLDQEVLELVEEHQVDVLMLAESEIDDTQLLTALNQRLNTGTQYHQNSYNLARVKLFSKILHKEIRSASKWAIYELHFSQISILIAVTHLPSKLQMSDAGQGVEISKLSDAIKEAEKVVGHNNTILVGDLNMNPFEAGVVLTSGLHAVMTRALADKKQRAVQNISYPFFYNPMWNLFGDYTDGPPGTYYYPSSDPLSYFWNMFDQVLIRPNVLPFFRNETLKIVDKIGSKNLLTSKGIPSKKFSDHLPIVFKLDI